MRGCCHYIAMEQETNGYLQATPITFGTYLPTGDRQVSAADLIRLKTYTTTDYTSAIDTKTLLLRALF